MTDHGSTADAGVDLDLLRAALDSLPLASIPVDEEPPASVLAGARWVHEFLTMDAELAELTFDSSVDGELAGVRADTALRELTFVTGDWTLEIEIEPSRQGVVITGTVAPPLVGDLEVVVGGILHSGSFGDDGTCTIESVPHGTLLAFIDTADGKVRLGAFEV